MMAEVIANLARDRRWFTSIFSFASLAVLPVRVFQCSHISLDDVCDPEEAEAWSVWGVYPGAGARERLEDFAIRAAAEALADLLRCAYPHLAGD